MPVFSCEVEPVVFKGKLNEKEVKKEAYALLNLNGFENNQKFC